MLAAAAREEKGIKGGGGRVFSPGNFCSSDDYRHESGMWHTLPFFLTGKLKKKHLTHERTIFSYIILNIYNIFQVIINKLYENKPRGKESTEVL